MTRQYKQNFNRKIEESEIIDELVLIIDEYGDIFTYLIDGLREYINDTIINECLYENHKTKQQMFNYAVNTYINLMVVTKDEEKTIKKVFNNLKI